MDTLDADADYRRLLEQGRAALAAGRDGDAVRLLGDAVVLRPDEPWGHVELAAALRRAGRADMAHRAYSRALEADPSGPAGAAAAEGLSGLRPASGPAQRDNFEVGRRLAVEREVGAWTVLDVRRGGFGVVYVVRSEETGQKHALKTFDVRLLWSDEDRDRFEREALTWVGLDPYRHVATARWVERIEGLPCVVTDYAEGGDLARVLAARGPLEPAEALRYARHLCDGLRHAHEQLGIVHRDVKPANCLLTADGTLQVTDFGLARAFEDDAQGPPAGLGVLPAGAHPLYTTVAGTPPYMAPEQFTPGVALDSRTDVYAFGVVLFQMLTGRLPPPGGQAPRYVALTSRRRDLRSPLYRLVLACTESRREDRPADFAEVRTLLDDVHASVTGTPPPAPPAARPLTAEEWVSKSLALGHLGRCDEALEAARRGLEAAEDEGPVIRSKLWQVRGMALQDCGRPGEALAAYDRAVEANPREPSAWMCRGSALATAGRAEEALACYDRGLELAPGDGLAWGNKGHLLGTLGRHEEAEEALAKACDLRPGDVTVLLFRVSFRRDTGRLDAALAEVEQALRIAPRHWQSLATKGLVLMDLGRPAEALPCMELAAEIEPGQQDVWCYVLEVHRALGQYGEVLKYCDRALRVGPETAVLWVTRGVALSAVRGGHSEEEVSAYERALSLDPRSGPAWHNRGLALESLGRPADAHASFRQALRAAPDDESARNGLARTRDAGPEPATPDPG